MQEQADASTLRVLETLNEAQACWYVARETLARGRGGLKAMHELSGLSRPTILKGIRELQQGTRLKTGERDEQFRYINRLVKQYLRRGDPVLSVETKKKERAGNFKNPGQTWRPRGKPSGVNIYDFPRLGERPAIPYGAYDVGRN